MVAVTIILRMTASLQSCSAEYSKRVSCFCFLVLLHQTALAKVIEQLIVVIDGEPYTLSNLGMYAKTKMDREFPSGDLKKINDSDREVLEQFITEKLLEAEARESGIKVTDQDVTQYIDEIKKRNRLSDDELKAALSREGQTLESYRASVKSELEKSEIVNRQVRNKVNITNDDVERYYKLNANKLSLRGSCALASYPARAP